MEKEKAYPKVGEGQAFVELTVVYNDRVERSRDLVTREAGKEANRRYMEMMEELNP